MKKLLSLLLCLSLFSSLLCLPAFATEHNPFDDVNEKDYFYAPVLWAVENSITTGTGKTTFSPNNTCTRAQVVTFLWRAAGKPAPQSTENYFTDVAKGAYYYEAVLWAVEEGITNGLTQSTFGPESSCTRAQVVTFLWRAEGRPAPKSDENPFTDVAEGAYYYEAVLWAVEQGITTGMTKTTFGPESPCTRGQIVTFIYRSMTSAEPLEIVFQPEDYRMTCSQEDASFSVTIRGGSAPYTYQWVVLYDNDEVKADPVTTTGTIHVFTRNFSDYDFDDYRAIGAYCVITDSKGNSVESDFAEVLQYVYKPLSIKTQPKDYQMRGSQEDAEFTIEVENGRGPYTYRWFVMYDSEAVWSATVESNELSNTFVWNFSDYDFDDHNLIRVGCIVGDAKGDGLQSDFAIVFPKS